MGAGIVWLAALRRLGFVGAIAPLVVGATLLGAGLYQAVSSDRRASEVAALGALLGALVAPLLGFAVGVLAAVFLLLFAVAAGLAAGARALALEPAVADVPPPEHSLSLVAKVAIDEALLGYELANGGRFAVDGELGRVVEETEAGRAWLLGHGFLARPETYHENPPPLEAPAIRRFRAAGHELELLRFESGYAPHVGETGRERWLAKDECRTAYAYVARRAGPGRPWLICTNGYRMGFAAIDARLFERFFARLGLNVLIPVLPLHGPRRTGFHSGSGFLGLDVLDTLHAEAQAIWDMRRLLSWIRMQEPSAVGAIGFSLGGYTTAVFTSIADGLACAIPGIALADIPRMLARHAQPHELARALAAGYSLESASEILRVVSPLSLVPRVPKSGRLLFGAVADRLVTPDQVRDLWRHWDDPEIVWYQGGHVTFRTARAVWSAIDRKLAAVGLVAREVSG